MINTCHCDNDNLSELDEEIVNELENLESCNATKVLENTRFFAAELDDLADLCDHKKEGGLELYEALGLKGEPKFPHLKVDNQLLLDKYKWDQNDVDGLLNNFSRANYAWERYQDCINRNGTKSESVE